VACPALGAPPPGSDCPQFAIPGLALTGTNLLLELAAGLLLILIGRSAFSARRRRARARPPR